MAFLRASAFLALLSSLAILVQIRPAHACLGAGSASLILQMIAGGAAGAVVVLKLYWRKITDLFRRRKPDAKTAPKT